MSTNVDYIGDEAFFILFDVETGDCLQRIMKPIDAENPMAGHYVGIACFESLPDANQCLRTIPASVRKKYKPRKDSLRMILANANADGKHVHNDLKTGEAYTTITFGALVFDGTGSVIKKVIVGG